MYRKILVANDGSDGALKALTVASDLARRCEAELHAIMVQERLPQHSAAVIGGALRTTQEADKYLRTHAIRAGMIATEAGVRLKSHLMMGHEVETIVTFAKEHGFDLLVVGFIGHSKLSATQWGSTSVNLTRLAPCSVLVVK